MAITTLANVLIIFAVLVSVRSTINPRELNLMTLWQILSHTFSTISEDAAAEVELSRLILRRCTKLVCRLCLDALYQQSKGPLALMFYL